MICTARLPTGWPAGRRCRGSPVVLEQRDTGGALAARLARAGVQSLLGLPLVLDRKLLGVLYVGRRTHRPFSDDDAALLQLVGDRVALAVDRARLFEQERHIAETLQRSLLPEQLPRIPGLAVAVRYLPAGAGMEVGGDWFDMLELSDGRVVLVMGDVVGRGVRAAAMMGDFGPRSRPMPMTADPRGGPGAPSLPDGAAAPGGDGDTLYVAIDADRGGAELASAGHLPAHPSRRRGDAFRSANGLAPARGAPLVRFGRLAWSWGRLRARLYTDGLVEVRGRASSCASKRYGAPLKSVR